MSTLNLVCDRVMKIAGVLGVAGGVGELVHLVFGRNFPWARDPAAILTSIPVFIPLVYKVWTGKPFFGEITGDIYGSD